MEKMKPQKTAQKSAAEELAPGQSVPLLKALHILTHNGGINADSRRKLKQVQHLAQLIKPAIDAALAEKPEPVLADLGAGKSYLGFILRWWKRPRRSPRKAALIAWILSKAPSRKAKWARWTSSRRCMPVTPPPTRRSCLR
jgi:hypothetical protein